MPHKPVVTGLGRALLPGFGCVVSADDGRHKVVLPVGPVHDGECVDARLLLLVFFWEILVCAAENNQAHTNHNANRSGVWRAPLSLSLSLSFILLFFPSIRSCSVVAALIYSTRSLAPVAPPSPFLYASKLGALVVRVKKNDHPI